MAVTVGMVFREWLGMKENIFWFIFSSCQAKEVDLFWRGNEGFNLSVVTTFITAAQCNSRYSFLLRLPI